MSYLEKMSIQGIRSFGPDDKDKQVITFYMPLTLILGPNGTGKTTLIECMKYMTTGATPAGGSQKSTFIHDPKIAHETSVKAQVRLQLRNVSGVQYVVQRAMSATQTAKTIKCTTLDGIITKRGADGKKESITTRCADIDREMISLLGVGKPILENVIFCHQEDSCWPLSEGKALKQKFDDIFASTRYVKALDIINKNRKDMQIEIKNHQIEVKHLKTHKEVADKHKQDLDEAMARCAASRESVAGIKEKLAPIEQKLVEISTKEGSIYQLHTAVEKLKTEKEQMLLSIQELRDNIENEFEGTTEELQRMLEEFEEKVESYEAELRKSKRERERAQDEHSHRNTEKSTYLLSLGKLEQEAQTNKKQIRDRDSFIKSVSEEHSLQGYSGTIEDYEMQSFLKAMNKLSSKLKQEATERRADFEKKEEKVQKEMGNVTKQEAAVNTEITLKKETLETNAKTIKELRAKLNRVEGSADRLSGINQELKRTTQDLKEHERTIDLDSARKEIDKLTSGRDDLESSLKRLDNELSRMHSESGVRTQLDMFKKEKSTKEDQIRRLKARNEDQLEILFCDEIPSERFSDYVKRYNSALAKDIKKETDELQKYKLELSGKEQERNSLSDQLSQKNAELKEYEDKIFKECGTQNFDAGLENLDGELTKKRDTKAVLEGTRAVFDKYSEKLKKSDPPCPLCHRPFDLPSEVDELVDQLNKTLEVLPSKLERIDEEIVDLQRKYEQVLTFRPYKSAIADLRGETVPSLKKRVGAVEERISWLRGKISEKEAILTEKKENEERGNGLVPDMTKLDTLISDVKDLNKKTELQAAKLMHVDSDRTMQQVQDEKETAQEELDTVRRSIEKKQKKVREREVKLSQLQQSVNQLTSEKLKIEADMQDRKQMEDTMADLTDKNSTLASQIQDARDKLEPLRETIRRLSDERDNITGQKDMCSDEDKEVVSIVQQQIRETEAYQSQIKRYVESGREKALQDCKEKLEDLNERISAQQKRMERIDEKIQETQRNLDNQKTRERELHDNLTLRNKQTDVDAKTKKISELKGKLGDLNISSLERDKQRLRGQQDDLTREKHQAEGREQSQLDVIRSLKENLRREEYQNADTKHDKEVILLRTKELAADDLEKYHRALDRTIMSYHKMKMDDINKIIRELWRKTYRGNDIETIEICHDEDTGTNQSRRTYNYRVVMIRNDVKLDLRGRCSAGQRVLASLIIRLALAETFCLNCGILALDEPTTNLDRENIESLAYALVEIIKGRYRQKNFQLIIITHDEDFVELLGRSEYIDKFWKVRKNEFGCSRLVEANVIDLGTR